MKKKGLRIRWDRILFIIIAFLMMIASILIFLNRESERTEQSQNTTPVTEQALTLTKDENGLYVKDGIIVVNKKYNVPASYNPGESSEAATQLKKLIQDMQSQGLPVSSAYSGFRSYTEQETLYKSYIEKDGKESADSLSARPGYSEHQIGLAFDLTNSDGELLKDEESVAWIQHYAAEYGFIVRYMEGKEAITGYEYEPWHLRYVGVTHAKKISDSKQTLEEYLQIEGGDYSN